MILFFSFLLFWCNNVSSWVSGKILLWIHLVPLGCHLEDFKLLLLVCWILWVYLNYLLHHCLTFLHHIYLEISSISFRFSSLFGIQIFKICSYDSLNFFVSILMFFFSFLINVDLLSVFWFIWLEVCLSCWFS